MLICPKCGHKNKTQKHCGNCGEKLLADNVQTVDFNDEYHEREPKKKSRGFRWFVGIIIFILTWIIGSVVLSIAAGAIGSNYEHQDGVLALFSFILGVIFMLTYVANDEEKTNETANTGS